MSTANELKHKTERFLITLYLLANRKTGQIVEREKVYDITGIDYEDQGFVISNLAKNRCIGWTKFENVSITPKGKIEAEKILIATQQERELKVLRAIYELSDKEPFLTHSIDELSEAMEMYSVELISILTNLENKNLVEFVEDVASILPAGIQVLETEQLPNLIMPNSERLIDKQIDKHKVFVVHGRNYQIRDSMFNFLRAIGIQPIEWSEAIAMTKQGAPYIGDVLEVAFNTAQAIVVLMTPDDEARLLKPYRSEREPAFETELTPQPRQNVLIEAGMALGKDASRTVLVEIGNMRQISDIVGRHTVRLDNSTSKRQDIIDRLETAGCEVNIKGKRDWHTVGNFEIPNVENSEQKTKARDTIIDLPEGCFTILRYLNNSPDSEPIAFISNNTKIDVPKATYFLDLLETAHFVSTHYEIGYGNFYELTKEGRKYIYEHLE